MKITVEAIKTFGGPISMRKGDTGTYDSKEVAGLIKCGYLKKTGKASKADPEDTGDDDSEEDTKEEDTPENSSDADKQ